jgi:ABC-type microcin C transport system permease subunit YejE
LLVHIPRWTTFEKRRRFFNCLARFVRYAYGNVVCDIVAKDDMDRLVNQRKRITVPIYFTKLIKRIPEGNFNKYFDYIKDVFK